MNDEPLELYVNHAVVVEKINGKRFVVIISDHDKDKCLEYIFNEMNIDEVTVFTTSSHQMCHQHTAYRALCKTIPIVWA